MKPDYVQSLRVFIARLIVHKASNFKLGCWDHAEKEPSLCLNGYMLQNSIHRVNNNRSHLTSLEEHSKRHNDEEL